VEDVKAPAEDENKTAPRSAAAPVEKETAVLLSNIGGGDDLSVCVCLLLLTQGCCH
jgi:hypothetical protein